MKCHACPGLVVALASGLTVALAAAPTSAAPCPDDDEFVPSGRSPRLELLFAIDTTGSMGGLIEQAKRRIWSIATGIVSASPATEIRMGLLAYRDRGDDYVTRSTPLTADLDRVYADLLAFRAGGGGGGPESVNQALYEAIENVSWTPGGGTLRLVFLVGDAPPHMDYADDVPYSVSARRAVERGVTVNTLLCGRDGEAGRIFREIAGATGGSSFAIETGAAVGRATPFDADLARHSRLIDATVIPYGDDEARARGEAARERRGTIADEAPVEALADRAEFRTRSDGLDRASRDLVRDVAEGRVRVQDIPEERLPERLREMNPERRRQFVEDQAARRAGLLSEIRWLSERRRAHRAAAEDGNGDSFDRRVLDAVRCQGRRNGFDLGAEERP
jgi:hypothetical protein